MLISGLQMIVDGVIIGFAASVSIGPIGILCIQRTLNGTRNTGFISGLGAATADTIFAMLALMAYTYVSSFIDGNQMWFKVIGGLIVMLLGFFIFIKRVHRPGASSKSAGAPSHMRNYLSVLLITITNPTYFGLFLALFSAAGIDGANNSMLSNIALILGVAVGTSAWWFALTWLVSIFRKKFNLRSIWWLNKISGSIIVLLGALLIISVLFDLPNIKV